VSSGILVGCGFGVRFSGLVREPGVAVECPGLLGAVVRPLDAGLAVNSQT
jgi:hypothetical protein